MMKKISLLLVVLALVLSVGMVAAAEDVSSADDSQMVVSTDDNGKIGNFTVLQYLIDNDAKIEFGDYGYDGFVRADGEDALVINHTIRIIGDGGYIDANNGTMFIINKTDVTLWLDNITLKNTNDILVNVNKSNNFALDITNTNIRNNIGYLVYNSTETTKVYIDDCGFFYNEIIIENNGLMAIDDVFFYDNSAYNTSEEKIFIKNNKNMVIKDSQFIRTYGILIMNTGNMNFTNSYAVATNGGKYNSTNKTEFNVAIVNKGLLNMSKVNITDNENTDVIVYSIENESKQPATLILSENILGVNDTNFNIVSVNSNITTKLNIKVYDTYTHENKQALVIASLKDDNGNNIFANNFVIYVNNETVNKTYGLNMTQNVINKYKNYGIYVASTNDIIDLKEGTYNITTADRVTKLATLNIYNETYKAQAKITVDAFNSYYSYGQYFNITLDYYPTIYLINSNIIVKIYRGYKLVEQFEISPLYLEFNYLVDVNKEIGKYLPLSDDYTVVVSYEDEFNNLTMDYDKFAVIDPDVKYDTKLNVSAKDIKVGETAYILFHLDADRAYNNVTITVYNGCKVIAEYNVNPDDKFVTLNNLTNGIYNVVATYDGDFFNKRAIATTTFIVSKNIAQIEVIANDVTEEENVTVTVRFNATNPTDKIILRVYRLGIFKVAEYEIDPEAYQEFTLDPLNIGTYTIVAKYKGDAFNTVARDTDSFAVTPIQKTETNLTVTADDIFVDENLTVAIDLEGNNPTGNILIRIYNGIFIIDEQIVPVTTKSVVFENLTTGTYHVYARYDGDKYNTRAVDRDFFMVKEHPKYETNLDVETESIVEDEDLNVNITLDAENPTGDIVVSVYNGIFLIDSQTVSPETEVVTFKNLTAGTYHIFARYSGDKNNTAAFDFEFFVVKKVPQTKTNLTVTAESITEGEDLVIDIDFEAVNPTNNLTINVFDGAFLIESFNVAPDTKSIIVEDLEVGTYHVTAFYEGDKYNTPSIDRDFFIVKPVEKTDINLTVDANNIEEGEDLVIEINMDEVETEEELTVTVYDGLTVFNRYTVSAESQNITVYNLKAGVYNIVVSFPGDEECYPASETKFVYVAKHEEETDIAA